MKPIDLTKVLKGYTSGWLALTPDNKKVIAVGANIDEALKKAANKGIKEPILIKGAKDYSGFVPAT